MTTSVHREITYNYTSADDRQAVSLLVGKGLWKKLEDLRARRVTGRSARLLMRVFGEIGVHRRNPYLFQELVDSPARRRRLLDNLERDLAIIERSANPDPLVLDVLAASRSLLAAFRQEVLHGTASATTPGPLHVSQTTDRPVPVGLNFIEAIALGVLCNVLVCMAVWLTYSARSTVDKIAAIIFPITAFVAAGFEHSIANMYFIPYALFVKTLDPSYVAVVADKVPGLDTLTWQAFFVGNLIPVTIGNIIGGAVLVAATYWSIFLRNKDK